MYIVEKEGQRMALTSTVLLEAYLHSGWTLVPDKVEEEPVVATEPAVVEPEKVEPVAVEPSVEEPAPVAKEPPKGKRTRRKSN